jgi:MFS family permease
MDGAGGGLTPIRAASAYGVLLVATLAAIYLVSQILRNSIGVIAPDLAAEVGLSAAQLGFLSSAFFISFALAQIPLGIGIDRFGPKRCMMVCAGILVVGGFLFATATTPAGLIAARLLIGLGSSCYLMAPLAFFARRFAPDRFSTLAGIQIGLGTIGTMIATAPLAMAAAAIGWRSTFVVITIAIAVAGLLVVLVLPRDDSGDAPSASRETLGESLGGIVGAARTPWVMRLFLMHFTSYSGFVMIVGLWGGPYLTHVYGYSLTERGELLFLTATGQTVGLFFAGPLERRMRSLKRPVIAGVCLTAGMLLVLAAAGTLPLPALIAWLVLFGIVSAYSPILISHGTALFPPAVLGRGITLLNIGTMMGVFASQAITGAIIQLFPVAPHGAYPLVAYQVVFALQGGAMLLALLPYIRARDPVWDGKA